jgi:hypothetical protein
MPSSVHQPPHYPPGFGNLSFDDDDFVDNASFEEALSQAAAKAFDKTSTPQNQELLEQEKSAPAKTSEEKVATPDQPAAKAFDKTSTPQNQELLEQEKSAPAKTSEEKVATPDQPAPKQTPGEKLEQHHQPAPEEQEEEHLSDDEECDIIPESDCEDREEEDPLQQNQLEKSRNVEEDSDAQYFKTPEQNKKAARQLLIGSQVYSPRKQAADPTPIAVKMKDLEAQVHCKVTKLKNDINSMECSFKKESEKKKAELKRVRSKQASEQIEYTESSKNARMALERWVAAEECQQNLKIDAANLQQEENDLTEKMKQLEEKKMNFKIISKAADDNVLAMAQEKENTKQNTKECLERFENTNTEIKQVKINSIKHYELNIYILFLKN